MKLAVLLVFASLSSCGKAEEPEALAEREREGVVVKSSLNEHPHLARQMETPSEDDLAELERYLAEQARRMPKKKNETLGGIELPDNPLLVRVDRESKRIWVNGGFRAERNPIAEQFAAEYSKIASDQSAQPSSLTIPSELSSPDYVFGLEMRSTVLWLHAHAQPRLYTVTSRGGSILAEGLALDELERRFPEFAGFERLGESDLIDYDD